MRFGVAPLPYMKTPVTGVEGAPIGIFKDAIKDEETLKLCGILQIRTKSEHVLEVIRSGLWQPTTLGVVYGRGVYQQVAEPGCSS